MAELLSSLLQISTLVFAVTSMLSVGLLYSAQKIIEPLRHVGDVIRALVANFVLVPLLAYFVVQLLSLERPFAAGLILVATAAGAPFLIKLTIAAKADVAFSATLLVLLLPVTVIYMPFVVPLALPEVTVNAGNIAKSLVLAMLLPLAIGLFARARWSHLAARLQPIMGKTSSVALIVLIAATFVLNFDKVFGLFGQRAILATLIVTGGAFAIGYLLGGPDPDKRGVLGLGTAQRNISAAAVVATQSFEDPNTLVMVIVTSMVAWAILFPIAHAMRKRELARAEAKAAKLK